MWIFLPQKAQTSTDLPDLSTDVHHISLTEDACPQLVYDVTTSQLWGLMGLRGLHLFHVCVRESEPPRL